MTTDPAIEQRIAETHRHFVRLYESGLTNPEALAKEVFPDLYDSMPALAIVEVNERIEQYLSVVPTTTKEPEMAKRKKTVTAVGVPPQENTTTPATNEKPKRGKRADRAKQKSFDGMEPETFPDIDAAAEKVKVKKEKVPVL